MQYYIYSLLFDVSIHHMVMSYEKPSVKKCRKWKRTCARNRARDWRKSWLEYKRKKEKAPS